MDHKDITSECRGNKQRMYLKYNRDEITWIDPIYLTKEVAQDIMQFWLDTDKSMLCTARYEADGSIAHYWFDQETNQWTFLKACS